MVGLLVGIVTLAIAVFSWWVENNEDKRKKQQAKDKEIDSANNADDIIRASGGMRP